MYHVWLYDRRIITRQVQLDSKTVGTLFYDLTEAPAQTTGPAVWFQRTEISAMLP